MQNVIVTGGAGFIGSHVCKLLAESGFTPVTFDNLSTGHSCAVKWGPLVVGDIHDSDKLVSCLFKYSPVAVLHFAASAYVGESVTDPAKYYRNNVVGSLSLFEAMRLAGVRNLVFSSSCAVYGNGSEILTENSRVEPCNPYGFTKLAVERCLGDFDRAYGFPYIALRYFNACGASEEGSIGELHVPETHLIPLVISGAHFGKPVSIFGMDYPTPDATCIRDYIHVSDLATAHVLALNHLLGGGASETFNLGNGAGYSVLEVIKAVEKASGLVVPVKFDVRRAGDPPSLIGSSAKIERNLGWKAVRGLDIIVRDALNWHKSLIP